MYSALKNATVDVRYLAAIIIMIAYRSILDNVIREIRLLYVSFSQTSRLLTQWRYCKRFSQSIACGFVTFITVLNYIRQQIINISTLPVFRDDWRWQIYIGKPDNKGNKFRSMNLHVITMSIQSGVTMISTLSYIRANALELLQSCTKPSISNLPLHS